MYAEVDVQCSWAGERATLFEVVCCEAFTLIPQPPGQVTRDNYRVIGRLDAP
jgi:hypothetical protein